MNKTCALVHAYRRGNWQYLEKALTKLQSHHSLQRPLEKLEKDVTKDGEKAYGRWL